jgi:hypothetical protein
MQLVGEELIRVLNLKAQVDGIPVETAQIRAAFQPFLVDTAFFLEHLGTLESAVIGGVLLKPVLLMHGIGA